MGGIVFYQVLADSREISRTGIQVSRKYYLYKYGAFSALAALFIRFLEQLTGMQSNLDWVFVGLWVIMGILAGIRN